MIATPNEKVPGMAKLQPTILPRACESGAGARATDPIRVLYGLCQYTCNIICITFLCIVTINTNYYHTDNFTCVYMYIYTPTHVRKPGWT